MGLVETRTSRPRQTVEDFEALPEGTLAELIDGVIYVSPAPHEPHQAAATAIVARLFDFATRTVGGRVYAAPFDVHLPVTGDVLQPDVLWISRIVWASQ